LQIYQIYGFTLRKRHAQIVNLRIYCFTGRFSGTMEFTILRFYRFTARLGKRRALDPRLTQRHHSRPPARCEKGFTKVCGDYMSELEMQNLAIWCNRCLGALTKFVILWKKSSKFQSTGQISRPFVPPGSHPASHDVSCRFVVSSQHFKFSSS